MRYARELARSVPHPAPRVLTGSGKQVGCQSRLPKKRKRLPRDTQRIRRGFDSCKSGITEHVNQTSDVPDDKIHAFRLETKLPGALLWIGRLQVTLTNPKLIDAALLVLRQSGQRPHIINLR